MVEKNDLIRPLILVQLDDTLIQAEAMREGWNVVHEEIPLKTQLANS